MIRRSLGHIIEEFYQNGLLDESKVMNAVEKVFGGNCEKSTSNEDIYDHIDFWWDSPKKGRIGVDVKGLNKHNRKDEKYDDTIHWIEVQNVNGKPGWIYGKAEYIAFMTFKSVLFVKRTKLVSFALEKIKGKDAVYDTPKECYVPYKRKKWGRDDLSFKALTSDLEAIADFCIEY